MGRTCIRENPCRGAVRESQRDGRVGRDQAGVPHRLCSLLDLPDQVVENQRVERKKHVPIRFSEHARGLIVGVHG
jgi:hypothetical protein